MFPGIRVRTSGGGEILDTVPSEPAIIVSTPGAEPVADGGYGAALLLDSWALLGRPDLRAVQNALRLWIGAAGLVRPADRSSGQAGTDPEELFAAGYAACFRSALEAIARREKAELGEATVTAEVTLGTVGKAYGLGVTLTVAAALASDQLAELVDRAHRVCPYSRAVRGNIRVTTRIRSGD